MEELKYSIIKDQMQYDDYCNRLESLVFSESDSKYTPDHIELLTLLIEDYDRKNSSLTDKDPIQILKYLMEENSIKAVDLVRLLGVSKGLVSDILNYKKGLSKDVIRKLSVHFKVEQELFNREYKLNDKIRLA